MFMRELTPRQKCRFKRTKTLGALFSVIERWDSEKHKRNDMSPNDFNRANYCYCLVTDKDGYKTSYAVKCNAKLATFIETNMMNILSDTINFEIVIWSKKEALVLASYNKILGRRYLAIVKDMEKYLRKKDLK